MAAESLVKDSKLLKIEKIIDWYQLRLVLKKIDRLGLGPTGYDTLKLLKALILQAWHSLSDVDLEESLRVRMDFFEFSFSEFQNLCGSFECLDIQSLQPF